MIKLCVISDFGLILKYKYNICIYKTMTYITCNLWTIWVIIIYFISDVRKSEMYVSGGSESVCVWR